MVGAAMACGLRYLLSCIPIDCHRLLTIRKITAGTTACFIPRGDNGDVETCGCRNWSSYDKKLRDGLLHLCRHDCQGGMVLSLKNITAIDKMDLSQTISKVTKAPISNVIMLRAHKRDVSHLGSQQDKIIGYLLFFCTHPCHVQRFSISQTHHPHVCSVLRVIQTQLSGN